MFWHVEQMHQEMSVRKVYDANLNVNGKINRGKHDKIK